MPKSWEFSNNSDEKTNLDIELLKQEVGQRFPFYDVRFTANSVVFFCRVVQTREGHRREDP